MCVEGGVRTALARAGERDAAAVAVAVREHTRLNGKRLDGVRNSGRGVRLGRLRVRQSLRVVRDEDKGRAGAGDRDDAGVRCLVAVDRLDDLLAR